MHHSPFARLENRRTCRSNLPDSLVVEHGSMRVIELPPVYGVEPAPPRELPPVVGLLAALVIVASLLFIAHDGGEPASPALGTAPAATSQG